MVGTNSLMEYHYRDLNQNFFSVERLTPNSGTWRDQKLVLTYFMSPIKYFGIIKYF